MEVKWEWGKAATDLFSLSDWTFTGTLEAKPNHFKVCAGAPAVSKRPLAIATAAEATGYSNGRQWPLATGGS